LARCAACGFENRADERFCGGCGRALTEQSATSREDRVTPGGPDARQITVLFADVVGATGLVQQLDDLEAWRAVLGVYRTACTEIVKSFGGDVREYPGDGVLAYFGYPQAHEDAAERAVRAALAIVERVGQLDTPVRLATRVGIDTGPVVVEEARTGDSLARNMAVGMPLHLAARLQSLGKPDTVLITERTARLVSPAFERDVLEQQELKGIAEPGRIFCIRRMRHAATRFDAAHPADLTPFVGRQGEVTIVSDRWDRAKRGDGQVIVLSGPPGVGKSRLVHAFCAKARTEQFQRIAYQCSPYHTQSAFYPLIEELGHAADLASSRSRADKVDRLEALIAKTTDRVAEVVPLIARLLSIPIDDRYPPLALTPQQIKDRIISALVGRLLALAEREPLLCIVEDAQWIDPSTLEVLDLAISRLTHARVLVLITCRPEFRSRWGRHGHVTELSLSRLARWEEAQMVALIAEGRTLPEEVLCRIIEKADGIPLFVEELTKSVIESGLLKDTADSVAAAQPARPLPIPATLRDSMMSRLDRSPQMREVAQIAAVIDHDIQYELLSALWPSGEESLCLALSRLEDAQVLYCLGAPPAAHYAFKHALMRDAAYESLLNSKRRELHLLVAELIRKRTKETVSPQPELLAHHYSEGHKYRLAAEAWLEGGQEAHKRSEHLESIARLRKALAAVSRLEAGDERDRLELEAQLALGLALIPVKGYAAQEARETFARACDLCLRLGDLKGHVRALFGLWGHHWMRAEQGQALEIGREILKKADSQSEVRPFLVAHRVLGSALYTSGDFVSARKHLEETIARSRTAPRQPLSSPYMVEPEIAARLMLAKTLWVLGYPDSAPTRAKEAIELAEGHPYTLAFCHYVISLVRLLRGEPALAQAEAEHSLSISLEQKFPIYAAYSRFSRGCALLDQDRCTEGLNDITQGIAEAREIDMRYLRAMMDAWHARAHAKLGNVHQALATVESAIGQVNDASGRAWEAELYRLRGEFLLQLSQDQAPLAEASFAQALAVARRQQAKSWELRAAISLAELLEARGRDGEAQALIAPIYERFDEGFETADLVKARRILQSSGSTLKRHPLQPSPHR
jgi:class 3 adenylate cyclase/predicted ATPase